MQKTVESLTLRKSAQYIMKSSSSVTGISLVLRTPRFSAYANRTSVANMGFPLALQSWDLTTFRLVLIGRALLGGFLCLCFIGGVTTTWIAVQI